MRIVFRCVGAWLSAVALWMCANFSGVQIVLAPDFTLLEWRICAALLLIVALLAAFIAVRPSVFSMPRVTLLLIGGHLTAAIGTQEFLSSRMTCVNMTQSIDYLVPTDTGALLLFGPSLLVLVGATTWHYAMCRR